MPTPTITTIDLDPIVTGDVWEQSIQLTKENFDFSGMVATSLLRKNTLTGAVVHTFAPVVTVSVLGAANVKLSLTKVETAKLPPGHYIADVVLEKSIVQFGPYTPFRLKFSVEQRGTK